MTAAVIEKVLVLGSMLGLGAVGSYYMITGASDSSLSRSEITEKRIELLNKPNVRMLYSTMSFFYLESYDKQDTDSFFTMYDILKIGKPNIVALQISDKDYNDIYLPATRHPKFEDAMKKVDYYVRSKSHDDLRQMKDIKFEHLSLLYPIYYCLKHKCKVICGDKDAEEQEKIFQAKLKLAEIVESEQADGTVKNIDEKKKKEIEDNLRQELKTGCQEHYVEKIMEEMNPKFSILPQTVYKTIVGVVEPGNLDDIAKIWKSKFKSVYNHEILEDESKSQLTPIVEK